MKLYGITHCNTVKKARDWLALHDIAIEFHNFKKNGLDGATTQNWLKQSDWSKLVNRNGLTWRNLPDEQKRLICDNASASQLMLKKPSVIKRPVLEQNGKLLHIEFDEAAYAEILNLKP